MKLTQEINSSLARIHGEDHLVHSGLKESLMQSVDPIFNKDRTDFFPLRPSGCLKPMRDLYYDLVNFYSPGAIPKKGFEPRIQLIFQFGHIIEKLVQQLCGHNFNVEFSQHRVTYGELVDKDGSIIKLTGAIDWAMRLDGQSEKLYLVDSKSIGSYGFKSAPKEDNIAQMQLYMHSDWGRANSVDSAILIYFNKDNSDIKCIQIEYDAELAQKILDRMKAVFEYYKQGIVPPREYVAGIDWRADYSAYKDYDNRDFLPDAPRSVQVVNEFYKAPRYDKDALREFLATYENKIAKFVDCAVKIVYDQGKLKLIKENT